MASAKRLQKEAYRAWFVGLTFSTIAGVYTLWRLRQREEGIDRKDGEGVVESRKIQRYVLGYDWWSLSLLLTLDVENGLLRTYSCCLIFAT